MTVNRLSSNLGNSKSKYVVYIVFSFSLFASSTEILFVANDAIVFQAFGTSFKIA